MHCVYIWCTRCIYIQTHSYMYTYKHMPKHAYTHLPPLPHAYVFVHYKISNICMYMFAHSHPRSNTYTSVLYPFQHTNLVGPKFAPCREVEMGASAEDPVSHPAQSDHWVIGYLMLYMVWSTKLRLSLLPGFPTLDPRWTEATQGTCPAQQCTIVHTAC